MRMRYFSVPRAETALHLPLLILVRLFQSHIIDILVPFSCKNDVTTCKGNLVHFSRFDSPRIGSDKGKVLIKPVLRL